MRAAQRHNNRAEARTHLKEYTKEGDFIRNKPNAIAFRVTDTDERNIRAKAKKSGMNLTDYIVSSCLGKEIIIVNDISELMRELKAIGRNINQLTVLSNMKHIEVVDLKSVNENMVHIYSVLNNLLKKVS